MNRTIRHLHGKKIGLLFFTFILGCRMLYAQAPAFPINSRGENTIERWELLKGAHFNTIGTHIKPFSRASLIKEDGLASEFDTLLDEYDRPLTRVDRYQLRRLAGNNKPYLDSLEQLAEDKDSWNGFWNTFYTDKHNLFAYDDHNAKGEGFSIYIDPVLDVYAKQEFEEDEVLFQNTRGVTVRGDVDRKLGIQFYLTENQVKYASYVDEYNSKYKVLPGYGFTKRFNNAHDFFDAGGYITFSASRHINFQFGHGDHFIGQGHHSMILSDFGPNYLFLRAKAQVSILDYQTIFAEFTGQELNETPYDKKYGAFHHLSLDVLPNLQVGLFEGVIFHDRRGNRESFELNYLNPVIFYRSVDHMMGSPDNLLIGMDVDYIPFNGVQVYGQMMIDEFKISEVRANEGWWANKFGWQLGGKYINAFGINQLDLQLEYNAARPYMYSQKEVDNYTHYNQPLAHPLGANFSEVLTKLSYRLFKRWEAEVMASVTSFGADTNGSNWGGDPRISYNEREQNYGNEIAQGVTSLLKWFQAKISYEPWPNLFLELKGRLREVDSKVESIDSRNLFLGGGIKFNFYQKDEVF